MNKIRVTVALSVLALASGASFAQTYPSKPVRVLVASVAGGPPDLIMRGLAEPLRQELGQPIVVENMPAGDGIVAAQTMIRMPADGYTVLMASGGPITVNPSFQTGKLPYDPQKDFDPVVMIAQFNSVFLANAELGVSSLKELIALARAKPGTVNMATAGTPTTSNLYAEWFRKTQNIDFYNVPYKSNPQALMAVVSGEAKATVFAAAGAVAQAKAGKVRILALIGDKRSAGYPDLPTVREQGVDLVIRNWYGLFMRDGTSRDIVNRWNRLVSAATADAAFQKNVLFRNGMERASPSGEAPEAFDAFLKRDRALYEKLKADTGIKID